MSRAIIILVGTSLLTKHIEKLIQDFKNYIDGKLNAPCVRETLNNNLINFEVEAGKPLP